MPEIKELALHIVTFEPMEVLIHQFGSFGCQCAHGKSLSGAVVGCDHGAY